LGEEKGSKKSAAKICPECGADVSGIDVKAHRDGHYGVIPPNPDQFPDARKRYNALTALID